MIERKQHVETGQTEAMILQPFLAFEEKYKSLHQTKEDIAIGVAVDASDKKKLYVPMCLMVDEQIDTSALALEVTQQIFVCTGADYKYIGHGECNKNYCAVTATMCTEDEIDTKGRKEEIDICTLPLIHLFVANDDDEKEEKVAVIEDTKYEENENENEIDEESDDSEDEDE